MPHVTPPEVRPWWQDGVLGRLDHAVSPDDLADTLRSLGESEEGLGLDGVLLRPASTKLAEAIARVRSPDHPRLLVEIGTVPYDASGEALAEEARSWLGAGADGISIDLSSSAPPPRATVTRLYGTPERSDQAPPLPSEALRRAVDEYDDRVLLARRLVEPSRHTPPGPELVIETALSRKPWRAATLGQAIEQMSEIWPPRSWPGCEMGAPRRGPFAVGLAMDDAVACSAALHLTLRATPCVHLERDTELPKNERRRRWYRRLIELRRTEPALHRGDFRPLRQEKSVLGFLREFEAERLAVLVNLGRRTRSAFLPTGFGWTTLLGIGPPEGHRFAGGEIKLPGCGVLIARAGAPLSRTLGGTGQRRATGR